MARNRVLVQFPPEVIADVDRIAGAGKRTAFLVDLAKREVKLYQQREALQEAAGTWKFADHPELADGSEAHVRALRNLGDKRMKRRDFKLGEGVE